MLTHITKIHTKVVKDITLYSSKHLWECTLAKTLKLHPQKRQRWEKKFRQILSKFDFKKIAFNIQMRGFFIFLKRPQFTRYWRVFFSKCSDLYNKFKYVSNNIEGFLYFPLLLYLVYNQIWLHFLVNNCHFRHITQLKMKQGGESVTLWPCLTLKSILRQKKNYRNSNISPCKNTIFKKNPLIEETKILQDIIITL